MAVFLQDSEDHARKAGTAADIDRVTHGIIGKQGGKLPRIQEVTGPERGQGGRRDQIGAPLPAPEEGFVDLEPLACFT